MIFAHTHELVISGRKSQTRRLVKLGDTELVKPLPTDQVFFQRDKMYLYHRADETREITSVERNGRRLWSVGQELAVQPGRGKKAVARIRITGIRREDVRCISAEDVKAEGFTDTEQFWVTWTKMHDPDISRAIEYFAMHIPADVVNGIASGPSGFRVAKPTPEGERYFYFAKDYLATRPAEKYDAWTLAFEVVQP